MLLHGFAVCQPALFGIQLLQFSLPQGSRFQLVVLKSQVIAFLFGSSDAGLEFLQGAAGLEPFLIMLLVQRISLTGARITVKDSTLEVALRQQQLLMLGMHVDQASCFGTEHLHAGRLVVHKSA